MKKINLLLSLFPLIAMTAGSLHVQAETLHFPYFPTLSPDAGEIYFSYDGDILRVGAEGGTAVRIVSLGGNENHPAVSPDGKLLAFSSDINGNNDVFIVPVDGGDVVRLTWHEADDYPIGWSADSRTVYFESNRYNGRTVYSVKTDGGTPRKLFEGYFNTISNLVENPSNGEFYFNESGESVNYPTRKGYIGDHNPDIAAWDPATSSYRLLTTYEGKDTWPMADRDGNLYFVTDRFNREANIARHVPGGEPEQLTDFGQSVQYPSISFDGSKIVFLLDYRIACLDLRDGKVYVPQITVADNNVVMRRSFKDQKPSFVAVSPDGRKLALSIRGLLYVSDADGKYLKLLETPEDERVDEIVWTDDVTLYYSRTDKGYVNLFRIKADGSEPEKQVYKAEANIQSLTRSRKGDMIAFISGSRDVMVLSTDNDRVRRIAESQFWSFRNYRMNFSFDGSYLAFEGMNLFEGDIFIYSFKDKSLHNLTNSASSEGSPVFSPDGKNLYLTANLYGSSFPRGGGRGQLYRLPLRRYDQKPFPSDVYDALFEENAAAATDSGAAEVNIDYREVFRRLEKMPENGYSPYTFSDGRNSWLLYTASGEVKALKISDPEAEPVQIKGISARRGYFTCSDDAPYFISGGDVFRINLDRNNASEVSLSADVEKDLDNEFRQIFYEGWAVLDQNFYDVNFHGTDWKAKRDYYASFLPYVRSRGHLRTLFNDMLGELNSSHLRFTSSGAEENTPKVSTHTAETGIIWNSFDPYLVDRILTDAPANNVDNDIRPGDRLVAVNGVRVDADANRESYLVSAVPQEEVRMTFSRNGKEYDVKLHTVSSGELKNMLYTEWEDQRRAMVDSLTDGRVAYIHLRDMTDASLYPFLMQMHTDAVNRDALILDLRYNNGGNVHKEVLDFLRQQEHFRWSYRDFEPNAHPNVTPADKPIVVLVNERSLSDAEVTSNGIRTLGIAKIVGTETYRWIIFTSGVSFVDGSYSRLPAWGCYSLSGDDLEFTGVKPDIYVRNTFVDRMSGNDPQLDAAIAEILKELQGK